MRLGISLNYSGELYGQHNIETPRRLLAHVEGEQTNYRHAQENLNFEEGQHFRACPVQYLRYNQEAHPQIFDSRQPSRVSIHATGRDEPVVTQRF